jgi:hypothetical protein
MELIQKAMIDYDRKGISHFKMKRTHSVTIGPAQQVSSQGVESKL